ncbi:DUF4214 domain-containing protein [Candidatus Arthromitus sp. SFB-turkey]|uniref:DUF4214 domain-containing protein n=1 Tax=Candidatus Arthromitus sp. SFB-turkey TaxID=1840217 RepID=UPI0007F51AA9|nr:DUF4214 domain-containing protein [Candidatus Arthromitus sp. SFB-turkey]OAT86871.1 hypothetical protein A6P36_04845 [Candidatus Arthromitus sp. SFB-turkey]
MSSKLIKKIIASTLIFSMTVAIGVNVFGEPTITVQADDDWYDRYDDDWDDRDIFKGNISISGLTTYGGRKAVTVAIPSGINIKEVDTENEPHDNIDEVISGGNIIIYGLRDGVTYNNLILKLEDRSGIDYKYRINSFTIQGGSTNGGSSTVTRPIANTQAISDYLRDVYKNVFGREVDQQGLNYWVQKLSSGQVDLDDFFKNLLSENEFLTIAPTPEDKIKKLYAGIFQRQPDQGGFNYWLNRYKAELRDEGNEREALREVIDDMTDGAEFKQILRRLGLDD